MTYFEITIERKNEYSILLHEDNWIRPAAGDLAIRLSRD